MGKRKRKQEDFAGRETLIGVGLIRNEQVCKDTIHGIRLTSFYVLKFLPLPQFLEAQPLYQSLFLSLPCVPQDTCIPSCK